MKEIEIYGDYIQLDQFLKIFRKKEKKFVLEMNFLLMEKSIK